MKAITLRHPWPFMVAFCGKDIENRDWDARLEEVFGLPGLVGQRLAIHGGSAPARPKRPLHTLSPTNPWREFLADLNACRSMLGELPEPALRYLAWRAGDGPLMPEHFIVTGICAMATLGSPTRASRSRWAVSGALHLPLVGVQAIEPLEYRGAQGFWSIPEDIEQLLMQRYDYAVERDRKRNYPERTGEEWLGL